MRIQVLTALFALGAFGFMVPAYAQSKAELVGRCAEDAATAAAKVYAWETEDGDTVRIDYSRVSGDPSIYNVSLDLISNDHGNGATVSQNQKLSVELNPTTCALIKIL